MRNGVVCHESYRPLISAGKFLSSIPMCLSFTQWSQQHCPKVVAPVFALVLPTETIDFTCP